MMMNNGDSMRLRMSKGHKLFIVVFEMTMWGHHHSSLGSPKLIKPWASKWRVRSVIAMSSADPGQRWVKHTRSDVFGYWHDFKNLSLCSTQWLSTTSSAHICKQEEMTYPVIRSKVA